MYCNVCEHQYMGEHICEPDPVNRDLHRELVRVLKLSCTTSQSLGPDFENMALAVEAWIAQWV